MVLVSIPVDDHLVWDEEQEAKCASLFSKESKDCSLQHLLQVECMLSIFYFYNKLNKDKMFSQFLFCFILIFKICSQCKKCEV
jgi:hypothetical protein